MSEDERDRKSDIVEEGIKEMNLKNEDPLGEEDDYGTIRVEEVKQALSDIESPVKMETKSRRWSPKKAQSTSRSPTKINGDHEEIIGGDITLKMEPGQPPKLALTASQKVTARAPLLFDHYEDKTQEATSIFHVITDCSYSNKSIGSTEHAMECDCAEEWDSTTKTNYACGDDSDCINRATKMECFGDCGCGSDCQNQRFQQKQYATVSVIKTEKKGYGLRADANLQPNDFIFEYIGEVIDERQFRRRMVQYDEEGIKHFYFMSLSKGEFVDATKKGNLGRFCNHSCNPNCYVDKWVVGDKLRMGIFAERKISAGEELVFNYNVDRYGADPQPCYCGEPNCTGFIGGKTQTERATKLSHATIEALGIDDGDGWDTAVAKKPRKKKAGEDDEEYVNNVQPRSLDEDGVTKVMATLLQCKEKWIAVKLLSRIQSCTEEKVINRVVKMHGYQILNSALATWKEDFNVVLQILEILNHFPRLTKNKISDSKIEATISTLEGCGDERVESQAVALLKEWSTLETAYRIPRMKRDPNSTIERHNHFERRESAREKPRSRSKTKSRSRSRSLDAPKGPSSAPTGPRAGVPPRNPGFFGVRPPFRPPRLFNSLPAGWFTASSDGRTYYYSANGQTTWSRPTMPAAQPPPPPKPISANKALDDIINEITSAKAQTPDKASASATPQANADDSKMDKKQGKEKWRTYSEEKQKKLYENTLFPHIKYVVDKYKNKLPREELKRFAKEIGKKLVNSDFKNHRVEDPTQISSRQEKQVKKYVKDYFDKAVAKKKEHDRKKAERKAKDGTTTETPPEAKAETPVKKEEDSDDDDVMAMSDDEEVKADPKSVTPITPLEQTINGDGLKRKREDNETNGIKLEEDEATPSKRARSITPPAPPPPPPPVEGMPEDNFMLDESGSYEDEISHHFSYFANGNQNMDNSNTEPRMAMDDTERPPPPPPPPHSVSNGDIQNGICDPKGYMLPGSFNPASTPGTDGTDGTADDPDQRLGGMLPERSRYLEAQESM